MTAMTGVVPRPGDLVRITDRSGVAYAEGTAESWRVTAAEPDPGRPGWCWLRGYDADAISDPAAGEVDYMWRRVLVADLVIRPGDGWRH